MTHGVDASMHRMKGRPPHPPLDFRHAQPPRDELVAPDDAVLPPRKLAYLPIDRNRGVLPCHTHGKSPRSRVRPLGVAAWGV